MFKKGMTRHPNAGRKKGTPNKKRAVRIADYLAEKEINPAEKILELIPSLSPREQVDAWLELQSYVEAKPKPRDDDADPPDSDTPLSAADILDLVDVTPREIENE